MNLAEAFNNQEARTENGMKAHLSSGSSLVDLFYKIGASRGKDIIPDFAKAFADDPVLAMRIALWARDIRGGAGERKLFRDILLYLEKLYTSSDANNHLMYKILTKVPEVGRFDDLLIFTNKDLKSIAYGIFTDALLEGNGLAAKWAPRKGKVASELRQFLNLSPKQYRKTVAYFTNVVETQMCKKNWNEINFSHVPSLAHSRYRKAFIKNAPEVYKSYVAALTSSDPKVKSTVKINAGAIYPYDVYMRFKRGVVSPYEVASAIAQWEALPNYVGAGSIIPVVDTSGSMISSVGNNLTAMDVAISLGLYFADKNRSAFKDLIITFSFDSKLMELKGNLFEKVNQLKKAPWDGSTNLHAAFERLLDVAVKNNVAQEDMPETILILSDMQFNSCVRYDDSAIQMIRRKYEQSGYKMPSVVFWNINAYENSPVKMNEKGVALVSGFSPAIAKTILETKDYTPEAMMMTAIMSPRYDF